MRILLVAPPWVPVPPPSYGGTELVIDNLARALQRKGHEVAVFATGDSAVPGKRWLFEESLGFAKFGAGEELAQVLASRDFAQSWDADVVHDHSLSGAVVPAVAPLVVTNHGRFDEIANIIYGNTRASSSLIAISESQASKAASKVKVAAVIHHGVDVDQFPIGSGGDYLAFLGRMAPDKGVEVAVRVAKAAGMPLQIAAKMREEHEQHYFKERVLPQLGSDIEYIGELTNEEKKAFLAGAKALLNPIQWDEPFGMVMIEAMACGTPVVGTPRGAAPEIIQSGVNGLFATSIEGLATAVKQTNRINRATCRQIALEKFSSDRMASDHEALYASVVI